MQERIIGRARLQAISAPLRVGAMAAAMFLSCLPLTAQELIPAGSTWSYSDLKSPTESWINLDYNDSRWATGPAQLGYGENDEKTVVGFGPNPAEKRTICYFRHTFLGQPTEPNDHLLLRLIADDGAVVYLNGIEIFRTAMPNGKLTADSLALSSYYLDSENQWQGEWLPQSLLRAGRNVLAVAVYQANAASSDLSFDLSLTLDEPARISRGPYLQMATPNSIQIRWRTPMPGGGIVRYGTNPQELTQLARHSGANVEHQVDLQHLAPASTYFYRVENEQGPLTEAKEVFKFTTPPLSGETHPFRVMVLGDSGTANRNAAAVRDSLVDLHRQNAADFWIMLGDNAYSNGRDDQYQRAVFDFFPSFLRQLPLWSTRGNHETIPHVYYDAFTFPQAGEAGGAASGTEAYYSFNWANVHFICLDSQGTDRSVEGAMMSWLKEDLAQIQQDWTVAFWHHPPYTKGTHDSDNVADSAGRMSQMRENVLPTLEAGGVDLVLSGHSHVYERSYMIGGHYGLSSEFRPEMKLDPGDGAADGDGAYQQHAGRSSGAVYCVAGSSGSASNGKLNHPAMFRSLPRMGALVLDFADAQMDVFFVGKDGRRLDAFRLTHSQFPASSPSQIDDVQKSSFSNPQSN